MVSNKHLGYDRRHWHLRFNNWGFEACTSDQCVYVNKTTGILIVTNVNDMLIMGKDKTAIKDLKKRDLKKSLMKK